MRIEGPWERPTFTPDLKSVAGSEQAGETLKQIGKNLKSQEVQAQSGTCSAAATGSRSEARRAAGKAPQEGVTAPPGKRARATVGNDVRKFRRRGHFLLHRGAIRHHMTRLRLLFLIPS